MKVGRNEPCPCGSGKKFKRCCMDEFDRQQREVLADLEQTLAMNPELSLDEMNLVANQKMKQYNSRGVDDFFGLSPDQVSNWLYSEIEDLKGIQIHTKVDWSTSPVMRYLELIIQTIIDNGGALKATKIGNLPTSLVKQASELSSEFPATKYEKGSRYSDYAGNKEDDFRALHFTRVLAELADIIVLKSGKYQLVSTVESIFKSSGVGALFLPMLKAWVGKFNLGYLDRYGDSLPDLSSFWVFMVWRLQNTTSADQFIDEVARAFPQLVSAMDEDSYSTKKDNFRHLVNCRFTERLMAYFGFVIINPFRMVDGKIAPLEIETLPLLDQVFEFNL